MDRISLHDNYYPFVAYRVRKSPRPSSDANSNCNSNDEEEEDDYFTRFNNAATRASHDLSRLIFPSYPSSQGQGPVHDDDDKEKTQEENDDYDDEDAAGWCNCLSFRTYTTFMWMILQLTLRLVLSLTMVLLVYYFVTKPPPPHVFVKIEGLHHFDLTEGLDNYGVAKKFFTCNCTIGLAIDNKSKIFGLHLHSPLLEMSFNRLPLAFSMGTNNMFAPRKQSTDFKLSIVTAKKPMYGAGPTMEDMLMRSAKGLPLVVRLSVRSDFRMFGKMIRPRFYHQARCMLLLHPANSQQVYTSTCKVIPS